MLSISCNQLLLSDTFSDIFTREMIFSIMFEVLILLQSIFYAMRSTSLVTSSATPVSSITSTGSSLHFLKRIKAPIKYRKIRIWKFPAAKEIIPLEKVPVSESEDLLQNCDNHCTEPCHWLYSYLYRMNSGLIPVEMCTSRVQKKQLPIFGSRFFYLIYNGFFFICSSSVSTVVNASPVTVSAQP